MVKRCAWGTCNADERYPDKLNGAFFVPFPKPKSRKELCLQWIKACGRPIQQLNIHNIDRHKYVCSRGLFLTLSLTIMVCILGTQRVVAHIGYPCIKESDCSDTMSHSTCTGLDQSNRTCECTNGFQASRGDIACTPVLGASCNNDADCHELEFGECRANVCHCEMSKVADNNECKVKVNGSCTADSECPTNAACTDTICKCVKTYVVDGDKCKSSTMLLKTSWFLMIAVVTIALLTTSE